MANSEDQQIEVDLGDEDSDLVMTDVDADGEFMLDTRKSSWLDIKDSVKSLRQKLWSVSGQRVPNSFVFHRATADGVPVSKIFFISNPEDSRDTRVFSIVVPDDASSSQLLGVEPTAVDVPVNFLWNPVLSCAETPRTLSKEEQLLYERKRKKPSGINWFEFDPSSRRFLFSSGSQLFQATDTDSIQPTFLQNNEIPPSKGGGARMNSEMCPLNPDLIAYVCAGNLWVINSATQQEQQLTFVHKDIGDLSKDPISAGFPSYIIQEEFDRYKGFWWQPKMAGVAAGDRVFRLLYEEVDETEVNIVRLFSPTDSEPEVYRFPVPGSTNAKSALKLMELRVDSSGEIQSTESGIQFPIGQYFPGVEYLVRAGWTPDGRHVWALLVDRRQTRVELVLFPVAAAESKADTPTPPFFVLYSEVTNLWINVVDMLAFIPCTNTESNRVQFIWGTEETGFRHLNLIESELRPCVQNGDGAEQPSVTYHLTPNVLRKVALTSGEWEVMDIAPLAISHEKRLIFFHGLCDSPIERHVYVVSYSSPGQIKRLTSLGRSYSATFNEDCSLVVLTYSSTSNPPVCRLFRVLVESDSDVSTVKLEPVTTFLQPMIHDPAFACPEISCHKLKDGPNLYAMIYRPANFCPTKKYPTILNVYGGPHVQLVYNGFRGTEQYWIHLLASQGYCIINIDSRGSYHRGIQFEAYLRNRMGTVELSDQVEVLQQLINRHSFINTTRLGIFGWSYGGYLSLMGLVQYPNVFKVCVAGAPVCSWDLYDTGYTERYMDLPKNNPSGYQQGSVLNYIQQFPDESDRLLIFQGLLDENVHFFHTAKLVSALIAAGKPHQLQIYPTERHSLRTSEASEHFEATFLTFLQRCL